MMALHLRQSRRGRILQGQRLRAMSIRFGRPPFSRARTEKAERELIAGKGGAGSGTTCRHIGASASRLKSAIECGGSYRLMGDRYGWLRGFAGRIWKPGIGEIRIDGSKQVLRDKYGNRLGEYDRTPTDARQVRKLRGQGNLLITLLR